MTTKCKYYVQKKNKYCPLTTKTGNEYCGEHLNNLEINEKVRIKCPLDPNHTLYQKDLNVHLTLKCPSRRKESDYAGYNKDFNIKLNHVINQKTSLRDCDMESISDTCRAVESFSNQALNDSSIDLDCDKMLLDTKKTNLKHLNQQSSIIHILKQIDLQNERDVQLVEFGAGKGELSYLISRNMKEPSHKSFVLIDRKNFRSKFDNKIEAAEVKRIKTDIKDLDLRLLLGNKPIVAYSKHLCGSATDLAINCLVNYKNNGGKIVGVLICVCCHQLCEYNSYTNLEYLKRTLNIDTIQKFDILKLMSSWAVCGQRDKTKNNHFTGIDYEKRYMIGHISKSILNKGRLFSIEDKLHLQAKIIEYTNELNSAENKALFAVSPSNITHGSS